MLASGVELEAYRHKAWRNVLKVNGLHKPINIYGAAECIAKERHATKTSVLQEVENEVNSRSRIYRAIMDKKGVSICEDAKMATNRSQSKTTEPSYTVQITVRARGGRDGRWLC